MDDSADLMDIMASQNYQRDALSATPDGFDLSFFPPDNPFLFSDLSALDGLHSAHDDSCCFGPPPSNFNSHRSAHDDLCIGSQPASQNLYNPHVSHRGAPLPYSLRARNLVSHINCPQGSLYATVPFPTGPFLPAMDVHDIMDQGGQPDNNPFQDAALNPSTIGPTVPESNNEDELKSYTSVCDSECMDSCSSQCGPGEVCREDNCANQPSSKPHMDTSHDDMEAAYTLTNVSSDGLFQGYLDARQPDRLVPQISKMSFNHHSPILHAHGNLRVSTYMSMSPPESRTPTQTPTEPSPLSFEAALERATSNFLQPLIGSPSLVQEDDPTKPTVHICQWHVHHMDGSSTCCGQIFATEELLHTHWEKQHKLSARKESRPASGSNQAGFWCDWLGCTRTEPFGQRTKLDRHVTSHTGYKAWECEHCNAKFSSKQGLDQHINTHTDESPYACRYCDKRFKQPSARLMHERTHTGEKPLECHICGKRFSESSNLTKHRKTHNERGDFICDVPGCGKDFKRADQLRRHKNYFHKAAAAEPSAGQIRRANQRIKRHSGSPPDFQDELAPTQHPLDVLPTGMMLYT